MATFKIHDLLVTLLPKNVKCGAKGWGENSLNDNGTMRCFKSPGFMRKDQPAEECLGASCEDVAVPLAKATKADINELKRQLQAAIKDVKAAKPKK